MSNLENINDKLPAAGSEHKPVRRSPRLQEKYEQQKGQVDLLLPRLGASLISFEIASVSGSTISSDSRLAVVSEQLISVHECVRGTFKTNAFFRGFKDITI